MNDSLRFNGQSDSLPMLKPTLPVLKPKSPMVKPTFGHFLKRKLGLIED